MGMRYGRQLFAALTLCLLTATALSAQQMGTITGRVSDPDGNPVSSVTVLVVNDAGGTVRSGVTDPAGNFRITNVPPGTYTVVFQMIGVPEGRVADVRVVAGETTIAGATLAAPVVSLDPLMVTVLGPPRKSTETPTNNTKITTEEVERRPAVTPIDHVKLVSGIDVAQTGVQSANVVARGFNNIFSGALHTLTDHRIASVPSLRVNFLHFVPANNEDIESIEVVLGPASALYGPNTASGVLHILTKSPLTAPGTAISVAGGEQDVLHLTGRTAHRLSETFGVKLSGQFLQANEWGYIDPIEVAERAKFSSGTLPNDSAFFRRDMQRALGIDSLEAARRIALIGRRDFDVQRWSAEARADWQATERLLTTFTAGRMLLGTGIELTGLGAGQAKDWSYTFYQARANMGRFFAQAYLNTSDAGDTYLLRNGAPIVDESRFWVGQLQHGFAWGSRQNFTYGLDYQYTDPRTRGTINGIFEDDDETSELGAYLQSETALHPKFDLVLAARVDDHSGIPDPVFSPRAAVVFKPAEGQALRLTYNRAFSTPSSLNQFLDLASAIPDPNLGRLGFSVRVQGTGRQGFTFRQEDGSFLMRSPFTPAPLGGPTTLLPATAATFFPAAVQVVASGAAARGMPLPPSLVQYLSGLRPTDAQIGTTFVHPARVAAPAPLSTLVLDDIDPIRESITSTFEVGYKGVLSSRLLLAGDVWYEKRDRLVTPLTIQTPLLFMNGPQLVAFLVPRFMQDLNMSAAEAQATAVSLAGSPTTPGLATIPVGVISSEDVNANGAQLLTTYYNIDDAVDYWGIDLAATAILSSVWSVKATASFVNENQFETDRGESVTLNAPKYKGGIGVTYDDRRFNGEARVRYTDAFPVRSGVYNATLCIGGTEVGAEPCIESFTLLDLNLGYRLPFPGASLQLSLQNLLDEDYRSFPGAPNIGRLALLRLKYEFR